MTNEVTRKEARALAIVLDYKCCLTCKHSCSVRKDLVEKFLSKCKTLEEFFLIGSGCVKVHQE